MKLSYTALMKMLKDVQSEIATAKSTEDRTCRVTYTKEENALESDYDYETTRETLDKLFNKELKIKGLLAKANVNTIVNGYEYNISEALVVLAQLSNKKLRLASLANHQQLERRNVGYNSIEYTKQLYDIQVAKKDYDQIREEISKLQMAIDLTNLTSFVEYED